MVVVPQEDRRSVRLAHTSRQRANLPQSKASLAYLELSHHSLQSEGEVAKGD
jgi:hypothetical protein